MKFLFLAAFVGCRQNVGSYHEPTLIAPDTAVAEPPPLVGPNLIISLSEEVIFGRSVSGLVTGAQAGDFVTVYVGRGEPRAGPCREALCLEVSDWAEAIDSGREESFEFRYEVALPDEESESDLYLIQAVVWYPTEGEPYKSNLLQVDGRYLEWISVAAGSQHTCAIDDQGVGSCWGDSIFTSWLSNDIPPRSDFVSISSSSCHSVGLNEAGAAITWGENGWGQATNRWGPFAEACGGGFHTCGRDEAGRVICWGLNTSGQTDAPTNLLATQLSCGYHSSCLLEADGWPTCWGSSSNGLLDAPQEPLLGIATGTYFSCGILASDSSLTCWGGNNAHGELNWPAGSFHTVAAGNHTACALNQDDDLYCWGNDAEGQIPKYMPGNFASLDVGGAHVCTITDDGRLQCWGEDEYHQASDPLERPQ